MGKVIAFEIPSQT